MGEAKRRAEAHAGAVPWTPPNICPKCKSPRVARTTLPPTGMSAATTVYDCCQRCGTVWETYPPNWCEDVVGAEPCDNCAFRPGAPEHEDPAAWADLIRKLRGGHEFRCHKGAPILGLETAMDRGGVIEFDAEWIQRKGRTCAGFMRMVWALAEKGESWLDQRYRILGVGEGPKDDADRGAPGDIPGDTG